MSTCQKDENERLRQELAALREAGEVHRVMVESAQDFLYLIGPDMRVRFVNQSGASWLRKRREEIIGSHILDLFPHTGARQVGNVQRVFDTGEAHFTEDRYPIGGQEIWLNARLSPVRDEHGAVVAVAGTSIDITPRKRVEQALQLAHETLERRVAERTCELEATTRQLEREVHERRRMADEVREREELFRRFFESSQTLLSMITVDQMRFIEVNPAFLGAFGFARQDVIGKTATELGILIISREGAYHLEHVLPHGGVRDAEMEVRTGDGDVRHGVFNVDRVTIAGRPLYFVSIHDITERKQLELQMLHAQKLESLGMLAGGIAHDFNNLLAGVLGNAELALLTVAAGSRTASHIEQVRTAVARLTELTNQMLAYAGRSQFSIQALDLSAAAREMVALLEASLPKKVALQLDFEPQLPAIMADASQVRQVLMNLVTNGAEAIGDASGSVSIKTATVRVARGNRDESFFGEVIHPGDYVGVWVTDTGSGIDPQVLPRIFDPFFSTKFTGLGLGLAAVAGIVRSHGGWIQVRSQPGRGSTFRVLFPASEVTVPPCTRPRQPPPSRRSVTVAVVDDDDGVREVVRQYLLHAGYRVVTASNGAEALALVERPDDPIAVVLLDRSMPSMDGIETAQALRRLRPELRIVLSSGYPTDATDRALCLDGFIQKPFRYQELVGLFDRVLADHAARSEEAGL